MLRPNDKGYNLDFEGDKYFDSVTIDQLIESLQNAKKVLGGNCIVMNFYDSGAGIDNIRSIYGINLYDNLVLALSVEDDPEPDRVSLYCDIPDVYK